jgi:hypothetical protein
MSQSSTQQAGDSGRPKGPSAGDVIKQTLVTAATFALVSAIAGPAVGAVAASIVGGASGNDGGMMS